MTGGDRLLGRTHALAALDEAVAAARAGRGGLLLVSGDAGIGKTALAGQVLRSGPGRGLLVVWAACGSGPGAPGYWPWIQVVRAVAGNQRDQPLPEPLTALLAASEGQGPDEPASPDAARFRLFDALAGFLARVSQHVPLVVVLDDLQWSDEPSLLALRFLAEQVRTARVLLLGTYRDAEAGPVLRELARGARVVPLAGLDEPATAELMERVAGRPSDPAVAHQVWLRTGGNPFFAREVTRLLGAAEGVPDGVRDILAQRLARLSRDCADLLGYAALAGREFAVEVLARATGDPVDRVVDLLEEAAGQRVLLRPPAPPGRYRFVHDLFLETVAQGLRSADRARRHMALARTLGALRQEGRPVSAARLATHLSQAGPAAAAEAARYASLAAAEAAAQLAYEDACAYLERALEVVEPAADVPPATRLELLLELGDARHRAGRGMPARDAYQRAADLARRLDDRVGLARAALGLQRLGARSGTRDPHTATLLEEAAGALSAQDGPWRALVLAALARDLHHRDLDPRSGPLAAEAVAPGPRAG